MNFRFDGFRNSGNGRDNSLPALEKYTGLNSTIVRLRQGGECARMSP